MSENLTLNRVQQQGQPAQRPTEGQIKLISMLLDEIEAIDPALGHEKRLVLRNMWTARTLTPASAGPMIDTLIEVKRHAYKSTSNVPQVPEGRYALDTEEGGVAFYRVNHWHNRQYVSLLIGPEEQKLGWPATKTILSKVASAGIQEAMVRYGLEIGSCGMCGRRLTNPESRAAGIGPVCASKL